MACNFVCVVRPSPLEGIRPCLTSSELSGQIECASVASPAVDEELLGKEGRKERRRDGGGRERKEEGATRGCSDITSRTGRSRGWWDQWRIASSFSRAGLETPGSPVVP